MARYFQIALAAAIGVFTLIGSFLLAVPLFLFSLVAGGVLSHKIRKTVAQAKQAQEAQNGRVIEGEFHEVGR
uniref:hypothetical protein n=1 Tax=Thaumasiovibrio occultus TaxID=1891184 RepID=UPI000B3543E7|nr:hypothetical protein [Thaumasiovibrio occultus]